MNQKFSEIYSNSIKNPENFWKKVSDEIFFQNSSGFFIEFE